MSDRNDSLLFKPARAGALELANRIVMAPLTRNRAGAGDVPHPAAATYYAQRASAGLLITEATQVSDMAKGYAGAPGCYTEAQKDAWRKVAEAVHAEGGRIVMQLWHVGRISHSSLLPGGAPPVAPSALRAEAKTFTGAGFEEVAEPRALSREEIAAVVADFAHAARTAREAGMDGVEVHGANGYLIDQFLRDGANRREDEYGGSIENRSRFLFEVLEAVTAAIGADRVGLRLSPVTPANGLADSDPAPLFRHVVEGLNRFGLAYLHMVEGATGGPRDVVPDFDFQALRRAFHGTYIANNGYDFAMADAALRDGTADLVAFGRAYIANPDLVERMRRDAPLAGLDRDTLYGGGEHGYTDYPALAA